jgi:hypothetical protein
MRMVRLIITLCCSIWISQIQAASVENTIELRILPVGRTLDIIEASASLHPVRWLVNICTQSEEAYQAVYLRWTIRDWEGRSVSRQIPFSLGSVRYPVYKNNTPVEIAFTPQKLGWHELTAQLVRQDDTVLAEATRGFAVIEPAKSSGKYFRYGVSGTGYRPVRQEFIDYIESLSLLGVDIVREVFYWPQVQQTADPVFEFQYYDTFEKMCAEQGLDSVWCFLWTPYWATEETFDSADWSRWTLSVPRLDVWKEFVRQTAAHFQGRVKYYEVWNEPDLGDYWVDSPANYARLQNAAFEEIHRADPNAKTLNGGFGMFSMQPNPDFLKQFMPKADPGNWDIRAYHDYHTFQDMQERAQQHHDLYEGSGLQTNPVWVTEGGYESSMAGGERQQAVTDIQKVATAPFFGLDGYFVFTLHDLDPVRTSGVKTEFGLLNADFQPKPAFAAYQRLIAEVASRQYKPSAVASQNSEGIWSLLYSGDQSHRLVLWQEQPYRSGPVVIEMPEGSSIENVVDMMGNLRPFVRLDDRRVIFYLSQEPVYVRCGGKALYPQVTSVLQVVDAPCLVSGKNVALQMEVSNPLLQAGCYDVALQSDFGLVVDPASQRVELSAKESIRLVFNLLKNENNSDLSRVRVIFKSDRGAGSFEYPLEMESARLIPYGSVDTNGLPAAVLEQSTDVDLQNALPTPEWQWNGPKDLSAKAWLAWSSRGVEIFIHVADQTHQPCDPGQAWRSDSVQIGLTSNLHDQEFLEIGVGASADQSTCTEIYRTTGKENMTCGPVRVADGIEAKVSAGTNQCDYDIQIPWTALGLEGPPTEPFRLSFIVNDNDGLGRKQWIQLSPGIGGEKNALRFPAFVCKPFGRTNAISMVAAPLK